MCKYWIFQANPAKFFIVHYFLDDYLKSHEGSVDDWIVQKRHETKFEIGDRVYIWKAKGKPPAHNVSQDYLHWQTGKRERFWPAGIYAIGEVVKGSSIIQYTAAEMEPFKKYYVGDTWKTGLEPQWRVTFKYIRNLVDRPLEEGRVWQLQGLSPKFRAFQKFRNTRSVELERQDDEIMWECIFGQEPPDSMITPVVEGKSLVEGDVPGWLSELVEGIRKLKATPHVLERAHESLVEDFFAALGYDKRSDIEWRSSYIDLSLRDNKGVLAVVEVKSDWGLAEGTKRFKNALDQGYRYSHESEARYVIVTNGDFYAVHDRTRGLSYTANRLGQFRLTKLKEEELGLIESLKKGMLGAS